jgi:hypothetical protein
MTDARVRSRKRRSGLGAAAILAAALATQSLAGAARAESWVPTGYEQHLRAAWAVMLLLCGPKVPDYYGEPAGPELCESLNTTSMLWLGMLLGWGQASGSASGNNIAEGMQVLPKLEPQVMTVLEALAAEGVTVWEIVAHEDVERAPESLRAELVDAMTRTYAFQLRNTLLVALRTDPNLLDD